MRGGIAGNDPDAITAIGNPDGIEGIEMLGYALPEEAPVLLSVPANVDVKDQVVAIVVMRRPAHRHRGPVPHRGQGGSGWVLRIAQSVLCRGQINADLLRLA